MIKIKFDFYHL